MNGRLLKAKRVRANVLQRDLASSLGITQKAMSNKEGATDNKFKPQEMLIIAKELHLNMEDFDAIFFDNKLQAILFENNIIYH